MSGALTVHLESPLPESLPVGAGTAVFCCGTCFHRHEPVDRMDIVVDGVRHRPAATEMPRPDLLALDTRAFRSGFWGTVPVPARDGPGVIELSLAVRLAGGGEHTEALGRIPIVAQDAPPRHGGPVEGLIAICMGTFDPDPALFATQVESLRAQTDPRWLCVVSDDCSSPERFAHLEQIIGDDERFVVWRSERRLGFYRNFERALRMAPAEAELLALCDQDDRWFPEKLETLRAALGTASLVYSDQRLVDADGRVLRETLWKGRRNNHTDLASLLVANSITGAATLFRREVAELALPFPDSPGLQFHDHWLGLVALAAGDVAYVSRPLYDYVQHPGAVFGDVSGGDDRGQQRRLARDHHLAERWRAAYVYGYLARAAQAQTLLSRTGTMITPQKRRALSWFIAAERSPLAFGWLVARSLRRFWGRNETLGSELELAQGIVWRWLSTLQERTSSSRRIARDPPALAAFSQKRLRRWRARV